MAEFAVTVTTSLTKVIPFNEKRVALLIHNRGDSEVFLSPDRTDVAAQGFPIPKGGVLAYIKADGDDARPARFAIVSAATADVRVSEQFELES